MTQPLLTALAKLRITSNEFFDALDAALRGMGGSPTGPMAGTSVAPAGGPSVVAPSVPRKPASVLPPATVPARTPKPALDAKGLATHLPTATAIAVKVVKLLGASHPQVRDGVFAQLALERIPQDDQLIAQAIEAAKGQVA